MDVYSKSVRPGYSSRLLAGLGVGLLLVTVVHVTGCHDRVELPSPERLAELERTPGRSGPALDMAPIVKARVDSGPYRVVPGEVIEFEMPAILYSDAGGGPAGPGGRALYRCRVSDAGMLTLPDGRQIPVSGKSLSEIETAVVGAYYPGYIKVRPSIYARVLEYRQWRVQIAGAVVSPGVYSLRHDQMTLATVLMEAGGIVGEGAALVRITRSGSEPDPGKVESDESPNSLTAMRSARVPRRPEVWDASLQPSFARGPSLLAAVVANPILLRFEHEGSLASSGWLSVGQDGELLAHLWLDIASDRQRGALIAKAKTNASGLEVLDMEARLLELVRLLDSNPGRSGYCASDVEVHGGWRRVKRGQFVTELGGPAEAARRWGGGKRAGASEVAEQSLSFASGSGDDSAATLILPVRGLNIPFADVSLTGGDSIVVERLKPQWVSVLGLVISPGNYVYPPETDYRLADVLALAGGLDPIAKPRYVAVYRLRADGTVASATFQLVDPERQEELTKDLAMKILPGDVVSVEQTPRTRGNQFFDRVFRLSLGLLIDPMDFVGDD